MQWSIEFIEKYFNVICKIYIFRTVQYITNICNKCIKIVKVLKEMAVGPTKQIQKVKKN
jgi:hypothetical protein